MNLGRIGDVNNPVFNHVDFRSIRPPQVRIRRPKIEPKHFPLLNLPPELRLLIYEPLIATGDLSVMRTNKLVYEEVAKVMKKNGVLRMNFGYTDRTSLASFPITGSLDLIGALTIQATPTIQQVEMRFHMGAVHRNYSSFDVYANLIKSFGGRCIARRSCTIFLDLGILDWVPNKLDFAVGTAWQAVLTLTGFSTLVLKIRRDEDPRFTRSTAQMKDSFNYSLIMRDYKTVREILETTLGPAVQDKSLRGHYLEFHPSNYKPEGNAELGSGV